MRPSGKWWLLVVHNVWCGVVWSVGLCIFYCLCWSGMEGWMNARLRSAALTLLLSECERRERMSTQPSPEL